MAEQTVNRRAFLKSSFAAFGANALRDSNAILVPSWTDGETRHLFVIRIQEDK